MYWESECLRLQLTSLVLLEKTSRVDNVSLQQIINSIPLFNYRYRGSFPSDYVPTLDNDTFAIMNTQPSNMQGEHWIKIANSCQILYFCLNASFDQNKVCFGKKSELLGKVFESEKVTNFLTNAYSRVIFLNNAFFRAKLRFFEKISSTLKNCNFAVENFLQSKTNLQQSLKSENVLFVEKPGVLFNSKFNQKLKTFGRIYHSFQRQQALILVKLLGTTSRDTCIVIMLTEKILNFLRNLRFFFKRFNL